MKGVSPVVATVLMVAVAIAAAVVAYSWFMSMQASVQAEASRGAGTVGKEQLSIVAIYCDDSNHPHVVLRNLGDEAVPTDTTQSFSIYVRDASNSEVNAVTNCSGASFKIGAKQDRDFDLSTCSPSVTCNTLPERVIVEVHAPGGAVTSAQQRIK